MYHLGFRCVVFTVCVPWGGSALQPKPDLRQPASRKRSASADPPDQPCQQVYIDIDFKAVIFFNSNYVAGFHMDRSFHSYPLKDPHFITEGLCFFLPTAYVPTFSWESVKAQLSTGSGTMS